jgi:hypothetical protein
MEILHEKDPLQPLLRDVRRFPGSLWACEEFFGNPRQYHRELRSLLTALLSDNEKSAKLTLALYKIATHSE